MPSTEDLRKIVVEALPDADPVYAAAGASDAARERLTMLAVSVPAEVQLRVVQATSDPQAVRKQVLGAVHEVQAKVAETVTALSPGNVKQLPDRAQSFALQQVGRALDVAGRAREAYEAYVARGRTVLGREDGGDDGAAAVRVAEPPAEEEPHARPEPVRPEPVQPEPAAEEPPRPKRTAARPAAGKDAPAKKAAAAKKDAPAAKGAAAKKAAAARKAAGKRTSAPRRSTGSSRPAQDRPKDD